MTGAPARALHGNHVRIVVRGQLGPDWADWFGDLDVVPLRDGHSALIGTLPDQAALFGLLLTLRDLGLVLVSLSPADEGV